LGNGIADTWRKRFKIDLWAYEEEVKEQILKCGENKAFLPGIALSPNITPHNDLERVVRERTSS